MKNQFFFCAGGPSRAGQTFVSGLCLAAILVAGALPAATYYLASTGNDAADGLTATTAWRTIDRVNAQSGDGHTFLFQRDDVFRGEITANGKFITYGAYGTGAHPIIKGSVVITNWTWDATRNCYVADNTNTLRHLFVNGELMRIARYPNADAPDLGWLKTDSGSSKRTFYDAALGTRGKPNNYWAGATARIRPCSWLFEMRTVATSTSTGTVTLSSDLTDTGGSTISPGWGYYLDGLLGELDHENEWHFDPAGGKVYLSPPGGVNPNTLLVEGMCREHGIYINWEKTNMTVENLAFEHQVDAGVETVFTDGATIRNCRFSRCEATGAKIGYASANVVVENNHFEDMLNCAISKMASGTNGPGITIVQSNVIYRTALVAGYGQNSSQQSAAIICVGGGITIRRNLIEDVGYVGIVLSGGNHVCEENIIRRAQLLLDDGGTLDINSHSNIVRRNLIFDTYGNHDVSNGQLESGWVHGQMGFCIFTQPNDNANIIEQNTLANNTGGILLDTTQNSRVRSNVVYNTTSDYIPWHIALLANSSPMGMGDQITDNIFYSLSSTQGFVRAVMNYDSGFIDRNYYCNPYGAALMNENYTNYTLAEWRIRYPARDPNSATSSVVFPADAITGIPNEDSKLFVNTNGVTTFFSFGGNEYQNLDGLPVTGGVTLAPFMSVVLVLRTLAPAPTNTWQPTAADYDGDGFADPAGYQPATGTWQLKMSSAGYAAFTTAAGFLGGTNYTGLAADFDGDAKADPTVYDVLTGNWSVRLTSAGYATLTNVIAFGGANYAALAADFDGDRLADPASYDASTADWRIKLSSAGYYEIPLLNFMGINGWTALAADFDGDAKADPAVYQAASGGWAARLSGSGYTSNPVIIFGGSNYLAAAEDFDGDRLADPAIYNRGNGDWSIKLSSGGYTQLDLPGFLGGME